jgi:radical SAM protein with 4Fe4S-binding SPASM domain
VKNKKNTIGRRLAMGRIEIKDLDERGDSNGHSHLNGFLSFTKKAFLKEHAYNVAGVTLVAPQLAFAELLNDQTARIVELLDGTRTYSEIQETLSDDLERPRRKGKKFCNDFLVMLSSRGIIQEHMTRRHRPIRWIPRRTSFSLECIDWALTHKCNMACVYCINEDNNKEMTSDLCDELVDCIISMGVCCVSISGGEPTLHPRFWDVVRELGKNAVNVTVETNGSTLSQTNVRKLAKYGTFGISLSIDSLDEADYLALGQNKVTPQHLISVIGWLRDAGIHIRTSAVLVPGINNTTEKARDLCEELKRLDVSVQCFSEVIPLGKGRSHTRDPDTFDVVAMLGKKIFGDRPKVKEKRGGIRSGAAMEPETHIPCIECGAGVHRVAVAPDGRVSPCLQMTDLVAGWLPQEDLENIWETSPVLEFFRKKENVESPICRQCPDWDRCMGGCKVRAGLYGGVIAYPDLWSCATYGHVRRAKRLLSASPPCRGSFRRMVDLSK